MKKIIAFVLLFLMIGSSSVFATSFNEPVIDEDIYNFGATTEFDTQIEIKIIFTIISSFSFFIILALIVPKFIEISLIYIIIISFVSSMFFYYLSTLIFSGRYI